MIHVHTYKAKNRYVSYQDAIRNYQREQESIRNGLFLDKLTSFFSDPDSRPNDVELKVIKKIGVKNAY